MKFDYERKKISGRNKSEREIMNVSSLLPFRRDRHVEFVAESPKSSREMKISHKNKSLWVNLKKNNFSVNFPNASTEQKSASSFFGNSSYLSIPICKGNLEVVTAWHSGAVSPGCVPSETFVNIRFIQLHPIRFSKFTGRYVYEAFHTKSNIATSILNFFVIDIRFSRIFIFFFIPDF